MRNLTRSVPTNRSVSRLRGGILFPSSSIYLLLTIQALNLSIYSNIGIRVQAVTVTFPTPAAAVTSPSPTGREALPDGGQKGRTRNGKDAVAILPPVGPLCRLKSPWETVKWTPELRAALQGEIFPRHGGNGEANLQSGCASAENKTWYKDGRQIAASETRGTPDGPQRASKWTKPVAVVIGIYHDYKNVSAKKMYVCSL